MRERAAFGLTHLAHKWHDARQHPPFRCKDEREMLNNRLLNNRKQVQMRWIGIDEYAGPCQEGVHGLI